MGGSVTDKRLIQNSGYILLSTYKNAHTPLDMICPKGHQTTMSMANFRAGKRCKYCAGNVRLVYEDVQCKFTEHGYTLLSKEYLNAHQKLLCKCPVGHVIQTTYHNFQQGKRCAQCSPTRKPTFEEVRTFFEHAGFLLLSQEYKNQQQKLECVCPRGHQITVRWRQFKHSKHCYKCNGGVYNPDMSDEERYKKRWLPNYRNWRMAVFDNDGYTCKKCGIVGGKLQAHHLNNYKDFPEQCLDVANGATLCKKCHYYFHSLYGIRGTTKEQFDEFLTI